MVQHKVTRKEFPKMTVAGTCVRNGHWLLSYSRRLYRHAKIVVEGIPGVVQEHKIENLLTDNRF